MRSLDCGEKAPSDGQAGFSQLKKGFGDQKVSEKKTLKHLAAALFEEMMELSEKAKAAESADETLKYAQAQAQLTPLVRYFADKLIQSHQAMIAAKEFQSKLPPVLRDTGCEQSHAEEP